MNYDEEAPFEVARYREMQKALPGVETLYTLMRAHLEAALPSGGTILIVGAGGGREVEELLKSQLPFNMLGVDPSREMLGLTAHYARQSGGEARVKLVQGILRDLEPSKQIFDAATSLLVMHFLPDDQSPGGKLAFLKSIRARLPLGALLIHADVCQDAFRGDVEPVFMRHARLMGIDKNLASLGPQTIASMPLIGSARLSELCVEAGFSHPKTFFQTLWYCAWVAKAV